MKKFLGIIFTCLLFASCENFLTGNLDTANKMAEEVRYNTAAQILVSVVSDHGTVVTGFNRDARVGIPFEIELSLPKNSGVFEKWYAVVRDKDNNETPLTSDDIVFENENSLKTNVTLLKEIRGVYIVAKVHENPVLSISYDNIDFYSKNSTSEAKSLIANQVRLSGNESFSYQNFVIQTTNDYGISFDRIKFISSDGVEEIDIPVYTLDQFYAFGENIPDPYSYIINCEDGNPETNSDNDGSYYSSAVTNSLLCLFNVTENNLPEGAVKVSFNACLFHNLESMVYVKPKVDSYLKILGNVEGYENTTITPNAPKVVLPSKDLSFKISIPDQYSYDSLSFSTESGAVPDVYISDSDTVDETLEEVKSAAFAIYSLYVETTDSNAYETKTTVSFNVKSINGFSETVIIKPVLNLNSILIPVSKKNENSIDPMVSEVRFHPGKDYTFTVSSVPGYNLNDLIFTDESNSIIYTYNQTKYDSSEVKPINYIYITDSKILDESLESVKKSLFAVYNFNPTLDEDSGEVRATFKIRVKKGYAKKLKIQADTYVKNTVNTPSGKIIAHPGKEYSVKFSSDNTYNFDSIRVSTPNSLVPLYTEDEYNWIKPSPRTYAFYSLNSSFNTSSEAVLNSLLAVYDVSILTSEGNNYESVTNASLKFRLINETDSNLTISPVSVFKKTVNFVSSSESSISPSGEVKTLSSNGVQFSINATDQYAISAVLIKDASENVLCRYEMAGKTFVPENLFLVNNSGENIVSIKNAKLESNLSKFSGTLFVEESNSQTISIVVETKIRPFIQSTDPYSFEKDVMRTAPITIRFSKPMKSFGADSTAYLNYFNVMRCDNAGVLNGNGENVFQEILSGTDAHPRYFKNPELKENNYQVVISPVSNTDESLWMKSGSEVRVSIDKTFTDEEGIPLLEDYYFTYTIGTKGDSTGPILSQEDTKLFLKGDAETPDEEIPVTIWGDFEPSDSPDPNHTYADSIHVVKDQMFKFKVCASDRDSKIKNFIAVLRLLYVPEGGNIPNSKQKASKNLRLFDEKGNWLYEAGYLEKDFYKEIVVPYSGNDNIAISDDNLCTFDLNSFFTSDSTPLPVDGVFQIELTACDELYNRADNSVFYYFVRDTTAPRIIDNQHNISFTDDCGISYNNKRYFGKNKNTVAFKVNNETLYDFGVQEKPKIAGSSDKVLWRVALATSKTVFDSTTMVSSWTSWKEASSIQKTIIPNSYFASHPEDSIIYPWISLKDENGLIRTGFCDNGQLLYIDVTSPKVPVLIDNSDEYFMNLNKDILTLNKTSVTTNWRLEDQSSIGIETYPKLVVKKNSQNLEPLGYSLPISTGNNYEIYAEDLLGNTSSKINFYAAFDTGAPIVTITGLNPIFSREYTGLKYKGNPYNHDITYEDFSFTVGVGDGFDYDLKQQSSNSSANGRAYTYTTGKVVLDFTVTETGHGIVENGIKITNLKISSIQIDDGPEVSYDDLKIFYNEIDRYYGPYTCIPITDGTINNNTKYRVKGELIPRKDDSDNIVDGYYVVEVYVSDGINDESSDIDSIILDTTPPELSLDISNDTQSWYSENDGSKWLYFKSNNGENVYNEIKNCVNFSNTVTKNDLSSIYQAYDNGIGRAFIEIYYDSGYRYDNNNYIYYKKNNRYMYFDPKNESTFTSINNIFPDNIISSPSTSHPVYLPSFSSESSNTFNVKVSDILGNSRTYSLHFYEDNKGPTLLFSSEMSTAGSYYYRNDDGVSVKLHYYPSEYIFKSASFYTEDGKHSFYTENLENAFLKDYSNNSTGTVWHYVAMDKVGNSYSDKITVVLDNIPPEITLQSFQGTQSPSDNSQNEFLLKLDLKDSISGLNQLNLLSRHKSVQYSLDSGSTYEDIYYDEFDKIYKISLENGYKDYPKTTKSVWLKVITSGKFPEFHISVDDGVGNTSVFYAEDKNAPRLVSISNNNDSFVNYNLTDQNIQRVGEFPESNMVYSKNGIIYVYGAPSTTSVNLRMKATDQSYSSLTDLFDNPNNSFKFVITNDGTYNLSANTIMTKSVSTTKTGGESYSFKLRDCYNIESNQVSIKSYKVEVTNDTTYPWVNYSTEKKKGSYSLSAGNLGFHNSSSSITYKTTATSISFDYIVISESNYDKLELIVDGSTKTTISGNNTVWTTKKVTGLSNGIHTFTWKFSKDGSTTVDNEKCLIDNIIFE